MIRVLVVATVRLYREGLALALAADGRLEVVGAIEPLADMAAVLARLRPAAVLLDITTPEGSAELRTLAQHGGGAKVVALGVAHDVQQVIALAEAGVAGYVLRDGTLDDVVRAIEDAARGELFCAPWAAGALLRRVSTLAGNRSLPAEAPQLSARERQIAELLDQGFSNKQIASRLGVTVATAKSHIHNLIAKLGVHRRGEAAAAVRGYTSRRP